MALGLGFACCCGGCWQLENCETADTITTTSDLSAYEKDQVLRRDETEGGGCWKIIALNAACDNAETFTVDGDPYTGDDPCTECLTPDPECYNCGFPALLGKNGTVSLDVSGWSGTIDGGPTGTAEYLGVVNLPFIGPTPLWRCTKTFRCGEDSFNVTIDFYCDLGQWHTNLGVESVFYNGNGEFKSTPYFFADSGVDCVDVGGAFMEVTWNFEECEPDA